MSNQRLDRGKPIMPYLQYRVLCLQSYLGSNKVPYIYIYIYIYVYIFIGLHVNRQYRLHTGSRWKLKNSKDLFEKSKSAKLTKTVLVFKKVCQLSASRVQAAWTSRMFEKTIMFSATSILSTFGNYQQCQEVRGSSKKSTLGLFIMFS